jgi:hypothetical protein
MENMMIQNSVTSYRLTGSIPNKNMSKPDKSKLKVFKSLMDRENECMSTPVEHPFMKGLKTCVSLKSSACLIDGRTKTKEAESIKTILRSLSMNIGKSPVIPAKIQIALDSALFGILHIEAIHDVSGIHVRLTGNPAFQKAVTKKIRRLTVSLSEATRIPTEVTCHEKEADMKESSRGTPCDCDSNRRVDTGSVTGQEHD